KLLDARIQRIAAGSTRRGLDDAGVRIGFHRLHQFRQAIAAHHAVGIEHDHVAVILAPATAEIVDVAALAAHAALTAAIEDAAETAYRIAQPRPGGDFCGGGIATVGIAQYEEIETVQLAGFLHRFVGGTQAGEHARDVFI